MKTTALLWSIALLVFGCGGGSNVDHPATNEASSLTQPSKTVMSAKADAPGQIKKRPKPVPTPDPIPDPDPIPTPTTEIVQNPYFDAGLQWWSVWDSNTMLVPSEVRVGKQALQVGSSANQRLTLGWLEPGKSYSLVVKARMLQPGAGEVAVIFREPVYNSSFRTFKAAVTTMTYSDVRVDFTVPVYSGVVDLVLNSYYDVPFIVDSVSVQMRTPISQTEPILSPVGFVPVGYSLAFNDEFNGTELNRSKWFTRYMYSGETLDRLNDEQQWYRDNDNHRVANGVLSLVAHKVSANDPWGINYESGMIRSDWTMHYGYFEARVKMPSGKGVWPAFWLDADVAADGGMGWPPEIDIFEFVYNGTTSLLNMIFMNVHVASGSTVPIYTDPDWNEQWRFWTAPYNFNEGWHVIGVEWTPETVTTYIDGRKIVTRTANWLRPDGKQAGPAHILLNLGIGGSWAGANGIDDSAFPQALEIDWVRAYKRTTP